MHEYFTASALTLVQTGTELVTSIAVVNPGVYIANAIVFIPSPAPTEKANWGDFIEVFLDDGTTETPLCEFGVGGGGAIRTNLGADVILDNVGATVTIGARYHNVVKGGNNVKGCLNIDGRQVA